MARYMLMNEVGHGTYGSVWRAIDKLSGEIVAIKKLKKKYYTWEECMNLSEVKLLCKLKHPNIVKLKEVIQECETLFFVFEYMEHNLHQLIKAGVTPFSEDQVRIWCFQILQGLSYMHQNGYFHRDMKPENVLVTNNVIKVADFGMAREISSQPPYTEYVCTRWYRAPELLLQSYLYGPKVDMWAMGAIMAELFILRPLFPGASVADEIYKICDVIGSPTMETWADGLKVARDLNYQFPQLAGIHLSDLMPSASVDAIGLITALLSWDPSKRPTAVEALQHPFFQSCFYIPPSLQVKAIAETPSSARVRGSADQLQVKTYLDALTNSKPTNNYSSTNPTYNYSSTKPKPTYAEVVQRNSELTNKKDETKSKKTMKNTVTQPEYRPPGKSSPTSINNARTTARGVSETTDMLANLSVGIREQSMGQARPPPVKWGPISRPAQEISSGRSSSRRNIKYENIPKSKQ